MLAIKFARDAGASTPRLMAWSTTITALALFPVAFFSPQPLLPAGAEGWLVLIGLAIVTQILGQGLIAYAFAHLPASLSSVSLLIQPVMAAIFAWIIFGEAIGPLRIEMGKRNLSMSGSTSAPTPSRACTCVRSPFTRQNRTRSSPTPR